MKFIPNAVAAKTARAVLQTQKHSPQTLFAAGLVGMGATIYLSCRATLKVEEVLEKHESGLHTVESLSANTSEEKPYSDRDAQKDKVHIYMHTIGDLGKLYGPAVVVGALSVSALAGSHNILTKRNAALAAAYGTIEKAFSDYRGRVSNAYGEKTELEIYRDVQVCDIEGENGKTKKGKLSMGNSPYARIFDEFNINWEATPEYNFMFLKYQQQYANNRLQAKGHMFLNEVYDALGMERSKEGAVVGWLKGEGDNFVDFGIFEDRQSERILEFMVGREKAVWLDFNVDGIIYDKI